VHPHRRLEEPPVGHVAGLGAEASDFDRSVERLVHLGFAVGVHIGQDQLDVTDVQCLPSRGHHRAVQRIAMRWHSSTSFGRLPAWRCRYRIG
jgi:hypothetical protein